MSASQVLSSFCDVQTGLLFLVAFLIAAYCLRSYRERGLPPGPWPWPIVGNMPLLAGKKNVYLIFYEMAKKFGNIFNVKIGSHNMVIVLGHKLIHEGLVTKGDHIIFRPDNLYAVKKIFQGRGIFFTSGKKWSDLRKLALVTMRDFGVGKKSLEVKINDEARMLQEKFLNYKSQPFDPLTDLNSVVANIISIIMFDSRFEFDDPEFFDLQTRVLRFFNAAGLSVPENFFPFLRVLNVFRKSKVGTRTFHTEANKHALYLLLALNRASLFLSPDDKS